MVLTNIVLNCGKIIGEVKLHGQRNIPVDTYFFSRQSLFKIFRPKNSRLCRRVSQEIRGLSKFQIFITIDKSMDTHIKYYIDFLGNCLSL